MANAAAAATEQAQIAVQQSKLPVFHADPKKDQFTGDQWNDLRMAVSPETGVPNVPKVISTIPCKMMPSCGIAC